MVTRDTEVHVKEYNIIIINIMLWKHVFLSLLVLKLSKWKIFATKPLLQSFEQAVVAYHAAI